MSVYRFSAPIVTVILMVVIAFMIALQSCVDVPGNIVPSESEGGCPGSLTTVRGMAQPGARITTHLTDTGQLLGRSTADLDSEYQPGTLVDFESGPLTSGYNYTFAITGRRGGYEVQHHYIGCGIPFFDIMFYEYTWDPPLVEDIGNLIIGRDWCQDFRGTPALCEALVYDGEDDWIDGAKVKDLFDVTMVDPLQDEAYSALFLDRVEIHDSRTGDFQIGGPDQPYANVDAYFIPNNEANNASIMEAYQKMRSDPDTYKPNAFLDLAKELSVHGQYLSPSSDFSGRLNEDEWEQWAGIVIQGPVQSEKGDCVFMDQSCIPFTEVGVDYRNFPLFSWQLVFEKDVTSVIAVFYEHDRSHFEMEFKGVTVETTKYQDDLIDLFVIDYYEDNPERVVDGSHVLRFSNRTVGPVDYDQDGLRDPEDNCPLIANVDQADLDGDGIGDVCDDDLDNDGVKNAADNCPSVINPDQGDNEPNPPGPDGIGDACDEDDDDDGVVDVLDNCDFTQNPDQEDRDSDGAGDACDNDYDGDGVPNSLDNCPFTPNPFQDDNEGDGAGDFCDDDDDDDGVEDITDNCPLYPNPAQEDFDADGVGNPCDEDDDGDGVDDVDDCDPLNERIFPGADEVCDGLDNDCDGVLETECGVGFELQSSVLETNCHAQFVCCYPNSCDPRDTDDDVNSSTVSGTVTSHCEAEACGVGGCGEVQATASRTFVAGEASATLILDTDEDGDGGGCGGHNETDVNLTVDVSLVRMGAWAVDEGPTVRVHGVNTSRPMTIMRGGIVWETIPAGSNVTRDIVLDWPIDYIARVTGDARGQWTMSYIQ